jgi:hypothetical protein
MIKERFLCVRHFGKFNFETIVLEFLFKIRSKKPAQRVILIAAPS